MSRIGRPTKLTDELREQVARFVRAGAFEHVAAQACGIGPTTFFRWMQAGARRRGRRRYREFRESVLQARAEARAAAEIEVYRTEPLPSLLCGPGRERFGEPGWSRSSTVNLNQTATPDEQLTIEVRYYDAKGEPINSRGLSLNGERHLAPPRSLYEADQPY